MQNGLGCSKRSGMASGYTTDSSDSSMLGRKPQTDVKYLSSDSRSWISLTSRYRAPVRLQIMIESYLLRLNWKFGSETKAVALSVGAKRIFISITSSPTRRAALRKTPKTFRSFVPDTTWRNTTGLNSRYPAGVFVSFQTDVRDVFQWHFGVSPSGYGERVGTGSIPA